MTPRKSVPKKTSSWATEGQAKDNKRMKVLRHLVCCLTYRRDIKREINAIKRDFVYNQVKQCMI